MNDHDDDDDDDVVDDRIFYLVRVNEDNCGHLNDDKRLYEHPYKFQVLLYNKKKFLKINYFQKNYLVYVHV